MTAEIENLLLENMKRFHATLERVERELRELKIRQSETHNAVLGLRRDQLGDAEPIAHLQSQFDGVNERLDRIERRLALAS